MPQPERSAEGGATVKAVNLALQGGGAHGAFAWGVLDRVLVDERISVEAITATSAGSMNAVAFAFGYMEGGRTGAQHVLEDFWRRVSELAIANPFIPSWLRRMSGMDAVGYSPAYIFFDFLSRLVSPYQANPFNHNPLRTILEDLIDFEKLRRECPIKLFLSATNVRTGKVKIFDTDALTI